MYKVEMYFTARILCGKIVPEDPGIRLANLSMETKAAIRSYEGQTIGLKKVLTFDGVSSDPREGYEIYAWHPHHIGDVMAAPPAAAGKKGKRNG